MNDGKILLLHHDYKLKINHIHKFAQNIHKFVDKNIDSSYPVVNA